jgi:cyclopropane-fatty-acyl-phospholipid synthase
MVLHRPDDLYARLGAAGMIGFGEAYQAGDWDCEDPAELLTVFARHLSTHARPLPAWLRRLYSLQPPVAEVNTPGGARRNIERHYDLPTRLFALFLDASMTYSSALFATRDEDFTRAQHRKIDRLLDSTGVAGGSRVLEIGTGWGELAIRAARRGARVVSVTLSSQQREVAVQRIADAGLADRVEVRLCDYRAIEPVPGGFDAVVSVEMIEAVGFDYWPVYATAVTSHLRHGGRAGLQMITTSQDRMLATRHSYTWIQKHIFPGGLVPSVEAIAAAFAAAGASAEDRFDFGSWHYAETLRRWRAALRSRRAEVRGLGLDDRTWNYYLAFCEAGFNAGYLDVCQLTVRRTT